jgi:hypothetical protein
MRYFRSWLFDAGVVLVLLGLAPAGLVVWTLIPFMFPETSAGRIGAVSIGISASAFALLALIMILGLAFIVIGAVRVRRVSSG